MNTWSETLKLFGLLTVELTALFLAVAFAVTLVNRKVGAERMQSWLAGGRLVAPLKGVVLGALTPFCSCSTLPMLLGMLKAGAPFAAAAAFLIASPLLNPIILGIIAVLFGWKLMLGYAATTFVSSVLVAVIWDRLGLRRHVRRVRLAAPAEEKPWAGLRAEAGPAWRDALGSFKPVAIPMLVGVSVGALIYGFVPETFLTSIGGAAWAVPVAALVGIPLYIRVESALPIGMALIGAGVGVGPVFALIIGGSGASIPEISMLTAVFKPPLTAAFVGSVLAVAVTGGAVLPLFA
ncbi:MAG: permease [Stackebrandtia sp.]